MERLTRWNESSEKAELTAYDDYDWKEFWNKELLDDVDFVRLQPAFDKLAEYEDAEEQGLLHRLPCDVGDTVYLINHDRLVMRERPFICIVDEFTMSDADCYAVLNANEPFYSMHRFKAVNIKEFGKTVFLTREEAEKALQALKEGVKNE